MVVLSKDDIASFNYEIISIGCEYFGSATESFLNDAVLSENSPYKVFVQFEKNSLNGFLILSVVSDEAEIIQVAVRNGFLGIGIGSTLINDASIFCIENGVSKIFLEVRVSNDAAVRTYLKNGFEKVGTRKSYYADPVEDAVIMSRKLCGDCG